MPKWLLVVLVLTSFQPAVAPQQVSSAARPIFPPQGVFFVPPALLAGAAYNPHTPVRPLPSNGEVFVEAIVDDSTAGATQAEKAEYGYLSAFPRLYPVQGILPGERCIWDTSGGGAFKVGDPLYGGIVIAFTYRNVQFFISWTVLAGHYPLPKDTHGPVDPKAVDRAQTVARWLYSRALFYEEQSPAQAARAYPIDANLLPFLPKLRHVSVPLYLPTMVPGETLPGEGSMGTTVYFDVEVTHDGSYTVYLDAAKGCQADACSIGALSGGHVANSPSIFQYPQARQVRLDDGTPALFLPYPPTAAPGYSLLVWQWEGAAYQVTLKWGTLPVLIGIADSFKRVTP